MRKLLLLALLATVLGLAVQKYAAKDNEGEDTYEEVSSLELDGGEFTDPPEGESELPEAMPIVQPQAQDDEVGSIDLRASPQPGKQEFTFDPKVTDPSELALLLADCWYREDPSSLERYMNDGEGHQMPADRRMLVSCFWRAVRGDASQAKQYLPELAASEDVSAEELQLLRTAAGSGGAAAAVPASHSRNKPLAVAMRQILLDRKVESARKAGRMGEAALALSEIFYEELEAPWTPRTEMIQQWTQTLRSVQDQYRFNPDAGWASFDYEIVSGDSLVLIRKKLAKRDPNLRLCVGLIREANGMRSSVIQPGQTLRIPTDVPNVVVDLSERLCMFRQGEEIVRAWVVGIGKEGQETPLGTFVVGDKLPNPSYMPVGVTPKPFGHPDNPLGTRWIGWNRNGQKSSYAFHGTSDPDGMGKQVSKGCIRMRNDDVEELDELLPVNSSVYVRP
ncbi:MAG: hypothetical protein ACI835_004876 [Planctomycetota bacterium]|jgi:hypothetical protein